MDVDLEKFFDKVNHDRLIGTLAKRIHDNHLLKLIRKYLKSGIMINPDPSIEDIEVSKKLVECGKVMGIEILDHLIVSNTEFLSLKEKGYL